MSSTHYKTGRKERPYFFRKAEAGWSRTREFDRQLGRCPDKYWMTR